MTNADTQFARVLRSLPKGTPRQARNDTRIYLGPHLLTLDPYEARITTRPVDPRLVAAEFLWMLSGNSSDTRYLHEHGIKFWDQWADTDGKLGPLYGHQWRWPRNGSDQVRDAIEELVTNPGSSRALVNAWEVSDLPEMMLPPCHFAHQLTLRPLKDGDGDYAVDLHVFQRSCDVLIGLPYNMAFYGLMTQWYAQAVARFAREGGTPLEVLPGWLHMHISDAHVYESHLTPETQAWVDFARTYEGPRPYYPQWFMPDPAPLIDLECPINSELPAPEALLDHCDEITPVFNLKLKALA